MNDSLEVVAAAFNQMLLFLFNWRGKQDTIIEIMKGDGPGRGTKTQRPRFRVPLLCISYSSFVWPTDPDQREALIDSVADISVPFRWPYMFEGISMAQDLQAFRGPLHVLCDNFGWAGPQFVRRLTNELQRDHAGEQASRSPIRAIADELHKKYRDQAADIRSRGGRDLTRITDQFATIYVAGCLAIRFKILPYTETDVLRSLFICQRDHVEFVDRELGAVECSAVAMQMRPLGGHESARLID